MADNHIVNGIAKDIVRGRCTRGNTHNDFAFGKPIFFHFKAFLFESILDRSREWLVFNGVIVNFYSISSVNMV